MDGFPSFRAWLVHLPPGQMPTHESHKTAGILFWKRSGTVGSLLHPWKLPGYGVQPGVVQRSSSVRENMSTAYSQARRPESETGSVRKRWGTTGSACKAGTVAKVILNPAQRP